MIAILDIQAVYSRGLTDPKSLTSQERLVYLLVDLETCADMEGWDHFFMHSGIEYYPEILAGLRAAGDMESLEILQDYERALREHGVAFDSDAIGDFMCNASDEYLQSCRDWREDYSRLAEARWQKVKDYLSQYGYTIMA
ncbi:hypothetical protein [Verrucomicrobium sp. BvORR106]|uniref:DMP19 family protein n=1 Tax=Verrucomicrobium sp. BvORR106 TaxID=1403819 RepID=UPI000571B7AF|nr:hypothetical protein [Verrucomicrobium sp. BvORR106]